MTAQAGGTKHAKGSGSAIAVYPVPAGLVDALMAGVKERQVVDPLPAFLITSISEDFQDWRSTDLDCGSLFFNVNLNY